jgi:hypothetical protein
MGRDDAVGGLAGEFGEMVEARAEAADPGGAERNSTISPAISASGISALIWSQPRQPGLAS